MKKYMGFLMFTVIFIILLTANSFTQAQPPAPPGGHGLNGPGGAAPIDGGSLLLILSSLGYGAYKVIREYRRK